MTSMTRGTFRAAVVGLVMATGLAGCTSTTTTTTTVAAATTTTTVAPTTTTSTTEAPTTTTSSTSTTTTTTTVPLTVDAIEVDLTTPCGVVEGWLAYASVAAFDRTWALTHPFTQTGSPLEAGAGGYEAFDNPVYQDETAMTAAVVGVDVDCSFAGFGTSFGESVGVVTLAGRSATGPGALGVAVRTDGDQWKVDNFAGHVSIVSPDPFGEPEPDERVVFLTPLGTFDTLLLVDEMVVQAAVVQNPVDLEEAVGTWVPDAPFSPGDHVVTVASMLENGVVAAAAVRWTVP